MSAVLPGTASNSLQDEAIHAPVGGAQKIVAGAGTGKTSTMVRRFAHLVEHHRMDPNRILAVTFTNRAAAELRDRVTEELLARNLIADRASLDTAWIGTFHALCTRLLRDDCYEIGFDRDTGVIDQLEERLLVKEVQRSLRDGEIPGAGILELEGIGIEGAFKLSSETFGFIQRMKGMGLTPDVLDQHCCDAAESFWRAVAQPVDQADRGGEERVAEEEAAKLICATYTEYERRLAEIRMMDFDGILLRTREALRTNPRWGARCRDRFEYLIVDEFQDTNRVQLEVLELLSQPGFANVSVVGDPKQSIYGWRDAEIRNILDFKGESRRLTTNYRSVQPILDLATHIIRVDPQFADEPPLLAEGRPGQPDSVCMYSATSPDEEARFMASEILQLREEGRAWSEIAILTRMRRPPVAFEQELRRAGIPYVTAGGHGFFEREEIKDLMSYLGVIHDPLDEQALVRMLQGPLVRCTDGEIYRIFRRRRRETGTLHGWDALEVAAAEEFPELDTSTRVRLEEAVALVRRHMASKAGVSTSELVQAVIDETRYATYAAGDVSEADRRLGNLRKLYRMATEFETRQVFSGLGDFIEYVDLHAEHEIEVGEADISGADAVRFLTVHAAKGLEFPVVFLAHVKPFREQHRGWIFFDQEMGLILRNLGDGVETSKHAAWKDARVGNLPMDLERGEMRRLMYVAITRAKERLYLSTTRKDEPTWESVLSDLDAKGRPRQKPDDDYFRTLAVFAQSSGAAVLLPRATEAAPYAPPAQVGDADLPTHLRAIARPETATTRSGSKVGNRIEVSFSQLEAFAQCPLRYRYIYEWRLPAPPDGLWPEEKVDRTGSVPASVLGTLVHATLEAFHQPGPGDGIGGMPRLAELWSEASRGVLSDQDAQGTWAKAAAPMFESYLGLDLSTFPTLATEQEFNLIEVVDEQEVLIRGFIDRLCDGPDGPVLVDYKTNTAIGEGASAAYARQRSIYERASRVILELKPRPVLVELRRGLVHKPDPASSWAEVEEMLRSIVKGRREAPVSPPCGPCAYRATCPASTLRRPLAHAEGPISDEVLT